MGSSSPLMRCFSVSQSPRSINWHRSLQNGRYGFASLAEYWRPHDGQRRTRLFTDSVTATQYERNVFRRLDRSTLCVDPPQETDATAM